MTNPLAHLTRNQQRAIATRKLHAERNRKAREALAAAIERMKQMVTVRASSVNWQTPTEGE